MWEDENVVLVTSLKKRILGGKDSVRFSQISEDKGIPAFIKTMFKERVERYIVEESPLTLKSTPHFKIKPEDLKNLRTRFLDVLRQAAAFPKEEIESVLREALILRTDYLVKPVDTMRRMLFKQSDKADYKEVEAKLTPFLELLSYAEYVLKQSSLRKPESLTNQEYSKIISELLHKINQNDPVGTIMNDFSVLLNFLSETKSEEITRVEAGLVQEFLADRNMIGFRRAVDVEVDLGKKDFSRQDLELTIKRYLALKNEFSEKEAPKEQKEPETVKESAEPEKEPAKPEKKTAEEEKAAEPEKEEPEIEWVFEDVESEIQGSDTTETSSVSSEEVSEPEKEEENKEEVQEEETVSASKPMRIIRREAKEEQQTEEVAEKKNVSIRDFLDKKSEKNFVKKLFGGNQEAFDKLIERLDEAESWRVAKILIDNELFKRDVDPFSREAIKLVDMVYGLYYPEEGIGGTK